jgi:hypothetical protein
VSLISADFEHEDGRNHIMVRGDGAMQVEATVVLTPSEWSGGLLSPGEYLCRRIEAWDTLGNVSVFTHETHPQLVNYHFRYEYPHRGSSDQEDRNSCRKERARRLLEGVPRRVSNLPRTL